MSAEDALVAQSTTASSSNGDAVVHVLAIAASRNEAERLFNVLRKGRLGVRPHQVEDAGELDTLLYDQRWDLIVHMQSNGVSLSLDAAKKIANSGTDEPYIVVVDEFTESLSCRLLEAGARRVIEHAQPELLLASAR
jgi:hypothetical protein